jgi:hypothetical protein
VSSEGAGPVTSQGQLSGEIEGSTYVSPDGRDIYGTTGGVKSTASPGGNPIPGSLVPAGSGSVPMIADHSMASQVDEQSSQLISRTNTFYPSDSKVYSWLSFGKISDAHQVEWRWFSPDGNLYNTYTQQIPKPSGEPWNWYNLYSFISIAGYNAASMPGVWKVDVYLDGQRILTEQFTLIGLNGAGQVSGTTSGAIHGGCHTDPSTGRMICIDTISDFSNPENQPAGGCHTDPATGQTICVDTISDFSNPGGEVQRGCSTDPNTGETVCID